MGDDVIDLFRPFMAHDAKRAVGEVLTPDSEGRVYLGQGPKVDEFEQRFGRLVGAAEPPLALNSCTSALELAVYLAVEFGREGCPARDYVISTPLTCTATNGTIARLGEHWRILWADCDPITGNLDPASVPPILAEDDAHAVMAVDWGGRVCDYPALRKLGPPIIQDAAHSLLAEGGIGGDYVCWSFQAIKHLTTGDGGALLTPPDQMERARLLRWYGLDRRSSADFRCAQNIQEVGFKMHMNDISAAIGLANLPHTAWVVGQHRQNAAWFDKALHGIRGITLPPADPGSSWWLYTLSVEDRDGLTRFLAERGIASSQVHARNDKHDAFKRVSSSPVPLPGVDYFSEHALAVPVGWWLGVEDRERVAEALWLWSRRYSAALPAEVGATA